MPAHFARSRTVSRVHPTRRVVWWGKVARHNSRVHSAAGKIAVAGNGRGVIVGCLQQYQKRWGFLRMATNRAVWPRALHDQQQQQQQRKQSWREQIWVFVSRSFLYGPTTSRGGGDRSGRHAGVFVEIND